MLSPRNFAMVFGIIYIVVGLIGFVPGASTPMADMPGMNMDMGNGLLLGLFPVNTLHNIVHLVIGIAGVAMARSNANARLYARTLAVVYGLLAVLGLIPATNTTFGLIPIYGNDVFLHAASALVAAYFGWMASDTDTRTA